MGELPVQRPEADFGVNLECPLLAIRRHCVVHLLDFRPNVERLLAQPSARVLPIDRARLGVGPRSQRRPTRCCEHAGATWLTEQFPGSLIACSGAIEEPIGMSMARNARSLGRFVSNAGRSITSTDVARDESSTLNEIHPVRDIHRRLPRTSDYLTLSRHEADYSCRRAPVEQLKLNVRQLLLVQSEVVAEFVDDSQADLCADFGLTGADCFDICPDRGRCDVVRSAGRTCSSWWSARHGRRLEAAAFGAPTSVLAVYFSPAAVSLGVLSGLLRGSRSKIFKPQRSQRRRTRSQPSGDF